jgi:hypothetical protein
MTIGRFHKRISHLTFWKPDVDTYFNVDAIDDGAYRADGLNLTTNVGSLELDVFGAQLNSVQGTSGTFTNLPFAGTFSGDTIFRGGNKPMGQAVISYIDPTNIPGQNVVVVAGQGQDLINQLLGVSAGLKIKQLKGGHIRATAIDTAERDALSNRTKSGMTGTQIYGADLDLGLMDRVGLNAEFGRTVATSGRFHPIYDHENNAFTGDVTFVSGPLHISAGYKYIEPQFYAPGYWGRIGNWLNPTNIKGPGVRVNYGLTKAVGLMVGGNFYEAAHNRENIGGLGKDDEIHRVVAGVRWGVSKNFALTADWEGVFWKLTGVHNSFIVVGNPSSSPQPGIPGMGAGTIHPTESYVTLGTGLNLTSNTALKLGYQFGAFDGKGALMQGPAGSKFNYGVFTAQANVRF